MKLFKKLRKFEVARLCVVCGVMVELYIPQFILCHIMWLTCIKIPHAKKDHTLASCNSLKLTRIFEIIMLTCLKIPEKEAS